MSWFETLGTLGLVILIAGGLFMLTGDRIEKDEHLEYKDKI
jgi:hypothetical protein